MSQRHLAALTAAAMVATLGLAGCGKTSVTGAVRPTSVVNAQATQTLKDGFKHVHLAAFSKLDANADGTIDEYEAGPYIDLRDMTKADTNQNGKLSHEEFMAYATRTGLFGWFHTDQASFLSGQRNAMLKAFSRLDANKDMLLVPAEMTDGALAANNLTL